MTVGRRFDPSALEPIPKHVHIESWIDQNRVLSHAEAVVTHCGSGTALGALAAGVPMVAVPLFADQFENSRRIGAAGAAYVLEGRRDQDASTRAMVSERDAPELAAAIARVQGDPSYRHNAGLIAEEIATMPTADVVLGQLQSPIE
jgi:UDP:flavonoid glycosyltransferase YjiC (YdhE family)